MKKLLRNLWFWVISLHLIMILGWFLIYNIAGEAVKSDLPFFAEIHQEAVKQESNKKTYIITLINKTDKAATYTLTTKAPPALKINFPKTVEVPEYGTIKIAITVTSEETQNSPQTFSFLVSTKDKKQTTLKAVFNGVSSDQ